MQPGDAVGIDAAQIASGQHVGGLFGVRPWHAEVHEHLSRKIAQISIRKRYIAEFVGDPLMAKN